MADAFFEHPILNSPVPARGREGEEKHDGHLLGARCEPPGGYGRWAFAEFTEVYGIEANFEARVEALFDAMVGATVES